MYVNSAGINDEMLVKCCVTIIKTKFVLFRNWLAERKKCGNPSHESKLKSKLVSSLTYVCFHVFVFFFKMLFSVFDLTVKDPSELSSWFVIFFVSD